MFLFGDISLNDIGNAVKDQIIGFDQRIASLKPVLSFGLNDPKYSKFYAIANDVSIGISGVCLAIAVIYAYLAIVKEGISLRGDWKKVVTILLRLAITKGLIDSATQFVSWIYSFPAKITEIAIQHTTNHSGNVLSKIFKPEDIAKGLGITESSSILNKFMALQYAKMLGFVFFILSIMIFIIALARVLKIYTLLAFGALAFAKIPMYGLDGCKEYIKEMCALGLQGAIISVVVCLFEVGNTSISSICNTGLYGSLGGVLVLSISMLLLIFKSEEIARKVI